MRSATWIISLLQVALAFQTASFAQVTYFDGRFRKMNYVYSSNKFPYNLYDFSREGTAMKAKYFAQNAYQQYLAWKEGKTILLVTAGAFSDNLESGARPVGLCVDNGSIVTRDPDGQMDGLVIVYNGGELIGGVAVVDLDVRNVRVKQANGQYQDYDPRASASDRVNLLSWGENNGLTLFQSQLVYSSDRQANFVNLQHGEERERRFLAICEKNGVKHHVVVDAPYLLKLNVSANYAKTVLEHDGFTVMYILNLDTGDKNLLHVYNGTALEDLRPFRGIAENEYRSRLWNASNLLVYYMD